jgi:hypothetical protein
MSKQMTTSSWLALAALLSGLAVAGCREEEQGRIVFFEPGTYRGAADQPLDAATIQALEQRTGSPQL